MWKILRRNLTLYFCFTLQALKSLSLKGYDQNQDIVRELLLYRLGLDQMPLLHLAMSFHSRVTWRRFFRDDEEDVGLQPDPDHPDMIPAEIANNPQHQAFIERAIAQDGTYSCLMDNLLELVILITTQSDDEHITCIVLLYTWNWDKLNITD